MTLELTDRELDVLRDALYKYRSDDDAYVRAARNAIARDLYHRTYLDTRARIEL